jgi:hypothetical protein
LEAGSNGIRQREDIVREPGADKFEVVGGGIFVVAVDVVVNGVGLEIGSGGDVHSVQVGAEPVDGYDSRFGVRAVVGDSIVCMDENRGREDAAKVKGVVVTSECRDKVEGFLDRVGEWEEVYEDRDEEVGDVGVGDEVEEFLEHGEREDVFSHRGGDGAVASVTDKEETIDKLEAIGHAGGGSGEVIFAEGGLREGFHDTIVKSGDDVADIGNDVDCGRVRTGERDESVDSDTFGEGDVGEGRTGFGSNLLGGAAEAGTEVVRDGARHCCYEEG